MVMIVKAVHTWILLTYDVDDGDDDLFCDNVDEGVVDEGAAKGIIVRAGRNRNAPTGIDKDSASKEWDDLNSDEE